MSITVLVTIAYIETVKLVKVILIIYAGGIPSV